MPDHDALPTGVPEVSNVVRACIRMTGAGVAIAVLPYALGTGTRVAVAWLTGGPLLGDDDATGGARVLLLCTLVAAGGVLALGVRAAWQVRGMRGGGPRAWLAVVAATLLAWCWPPLWFLTTPWMFVGATLAVRPLWWSCRAWGEVTADDAREHLRMALGVTAGITLLAHVMAWLLVLATAWPIPAEAFARVEATRRGNPVEPRDSELQGGGVSENSLVFYESVMQGATAAGRGVGGCMTHWQMSLGLWPDVAQRWIAPGPEGPTSRESWWIAGLAFVMSLVFWTPLMLAWTWLGAPDPRRLPAAAATTAVEA